MCLDHPVLINHVKEVQYILILQNVVHDISYSSNFAFTLSVFLPRNFTTFGQKQH